MKYYKNLSELLSVMKHNKNLPLSFQSKKYNTHLKKLFPRNIYYRNVYHTNLICSLTNTYKVSGDCNCVTNCSATQNDLELLFT